MVTSDCIVGGMYDCSATTANCYNLSKLFVFRFLLVGPLKNCQYPGTVMGESVPVPFLVVILWIIILPRF